MVQAPVGAQGDEPALMEAWQRRGGAFGEAPRSAQLELRFGPKEAQLLDRNSRRLLFVKPLGRRGLAAALAALQGAGAVACRVQAVVLEEPEEEGGQEQLHVLLGITLLPPFFEAAEESEESAHAAVLVDHWQQLGEALAGDSHEQQADNALPFVQELRHSWWQAQPQARAAATGAEQQASPGPAGEGSPGHQQAGSDDTHSNNLRDSVFRLALPEDWQLEAAEPPGLACTLFRYQRRCLAWLRWRESLGGAAGSGIADEAAGESVKPDPEAASGGGDSPAVGAAPADPHSRKSALPTTSLLWQPLVLPSGLRVWHNPLDGGVRCQPVGPPLPEVSGGLLCEEMGLGKTVEMMALFLANPPPYRQQLHGAPPSSAGAKSSQQDGDGPDAAGAASDADGEPAGGDPSAAAVACTATTANGSEEQAPRGGTLVVCPPALLQQWQAELSNHAHGALSVEVYDGLRGLAGAMQDQSSGQKRQKPAQREMELYGRLLAGEDIEPSFDAAAEAQAALRRLQHADVVLTSFDVLRAEVNFVPNARSFRRPKKYAVPHCPLLQVRWWRLVIDEAQMVGPLSAAGTMCERMHAVHRWCVTGTPMGAHRNELADLHALLHTLQHQPFGEAAAWRRMIADRIAGSEEGPSATAAWDLLGRVLRPLMWRNTKSVVAQEFHLPHRTLWPTWLAFQAGERAFYEQVVERARQSREELATFRQQQAEGSDGGDGELTSPAKRRAAKRRASKQAERLELAAADNLSQLRQACIHPQLTRAWREMAAEGQLGMGTTLSMEEIMQRLVDQAQFDLQEAERNLCTHLNTLAMRLMAKADDAAAPAKQSGGGRAAAAAAAAAGSDEEGESGDDDEEAVARPAKRPRRSKSGVEALGREALLERALLLLEQSFRVAEKGIAALNVSMAALKGMPDIEAASTSTVNAWKRLQINTASQLSKLLAAEGRAEEASKMDADAQEKIAYLRAQAEMELKSAQQRLEQLEQQAAAARQAFTLHLNAAADRGFGGWGMTRGPATWLQSVESRYREAQQEEERELDLQESRVKHMLGTRVAAVLDDLDKRLHGELTQLDRFVGEQHAAAAHRRLAREQARWDDAVAAAPTAEAQAAALEGGVQELWALLQLLPDFKRKTLQAQHVVLFSQQMMDEAERRRAEAERRKAEAAAAKAAAASSGAGQEAEVVDLEGGEQQPAGMAGPSSEAASGPQQQQQLQLERGQQPDPSLQQQQQRQQPDAGGTAAMEVDSADAAADAEAQRAAIQQAADDGAAFIPSASWRGALPGFCFKLGDSGVGYYRDTPPEVEAFLTAGRLHTVAAVVGRALLDHQRRLARSAGPEASLFASLPLDAVEAKLESVKQQIALVRCLKEQHVAERTIALKAALQADLDEDLAAAARLPPLPGGGSVDKLQREVDRLREQAVGLLHRKRYMASRVSEARQLHQPPAAVQRREPAQQQQQQQQQHGAAADQRGGVGPSGAAPEEQAGMECPVCLGLVPAGSDIHVFSGCGHAFCKDCAAKLVLQQGFCAVCRQKVTAKQVVRVAAGGSSSGGAACDPEFDALGGIQPQGEWSAKVEALLRRLLHLQTTTPNEKSLVFSQFPDALKLVALALQTNGIKFVQLLGGRQAARKAVAAFREDDDVRVFLLSHRAGAAGLTLVRANHVYLLEPALDPSIEQQAVARVHRIGQQRPVTVCRLLVRDSIEHRVLAVQEAKHAL
ncbi:E3 ubiquitin- ligase SHPRH [Chlorella sorokiniana]|uniref:E3 ubiquitin-ligase SHPRH n=1 Tax=Chlorella sorokiniana TaxID=3076 RepID=A0A2P6TB96_CHLSO|nr:E3 ubiquitin- ligase SHPRH [Chlorella sorokiniana]|eukprot:PRW05825.1 E3 ubiquitin- ligase SHPRH [Chlorella sorokiniana]